MRHSPRSHFFSALCLFACLALWPACEAPQGPPVVTSTTPAHLEQGKQIYLHGSHLGHYDAQRSAFFIEGRCADILYWGDHLVIAQIPTGIGTGHRLAMLQRHDGQRSLLPLTLQGPDLPSQPRACTAFSVLPEPEPDLLPQDDLPELSPIDAHELTPEITPDATKPDAFRYVRIIDASFNDIGRNPGADIDALIATTPEGQRFTALNVHFYMAWPFAVQNSDPNAALGWPNAFYLYPDLSECWVWQDSVALGGAGMLIVEMAQPMPPGTRLEVLEVGACAYLEDLYALPEAFEIAVGSHPDPSASWWVVGTGEGPLATFIIP